MVIGHIIGIILHIIAIGADIMDIITVTAMDIGTAIQVTIIEVMYMVLVVHVVQWEAIVRQLIIADLEVQTIIE